MSDLIDAMADVYFEEILGLPKGERHREDREVIEATRDDMRKLLAVIASRIDISATASARANGEIAEDEFIALRLVQIKTEVIEK